MSNCIEMRVQAGSRTSFRLKGYRASGNVERDCMFGQLIYEHDEKQKGPITRRN